MHVKVVRGRIMYLDELTCFIFMHSYGIVIYCVEVSFLWTVGLKHLASSREEVVVNSVNEIVRN